MIRYQLLASDGAARRGRLHSARGTVETPAFMPVGTAATVKTLEPRDLTAAGARIILGNTYHLLLRPGHELVERLGGLHRFMAWDGLTLTDSGGFQVFSLGERGASAPGDAGGSAAAGGGGPGAGTRGPGLVTIREEGVTFRSHLDGSRQHLSPERATEVQLALGADIIMAFDECPPSLADRAYHERSLARTQRWLVRCREAWQAGSRRRADAGLTPSALFGIAQGGLFPDLRARAIEEAAALDLPGYALGGYAVGEAPETMWEGVARSAPLLPADRPRYLMGVGTPEDLLAGIAAGVDMFDCVLPDPLRPQRPALHQPRPAHHPQRPLRRRPAPRRPGVRLLHLPDLHPGLPPPPLQGRGDPRPAPQHHPQRPRLPLAHGRRAPGHRGGPVRRLPQGAPGGVAGRPGGLTC